MSDNVPATSGERALPRRSVGQHLLVAAIYLAGYLILVAPVLPYFASHIFMDGYDGSQNYWNNWWVRFAVEHLQSPWRTDYLFHPEGITLIGATLNPFNGFVTVPLCWFVSPIVAFNLTVVFAFVMTGYATFLLAREVTGTWWPAVFAGAIFTFCANHTAHAHTHMQLTSVQWMPFFLWLWIRLLQRPTHRLAVAAGLMLFLVLLCDYYYTFYSVMVGGLLLGAKAWKDWRSGVPNTSGTPSILSRRMILPLVTFVVVCLLTCGPILGDLIWTMRTDPLAGAHDSLRWRNDLFALFIPAGSWRFSEWTRPYWGLHPAGGQWAEFGSHLGLTILALCSYAIWRSRIEGVRRSVMRWLLLGALFYALSLGGELLVLGWTFPKIPTPYDLLVFLVPPLEVTGTPVRMIVITHLASAVLAAYGMAFAWRRRPALRKLLLPFLAVYAFEIWPHPQNVYHPEESPVIRTLRDLPAGAVTGFSSVEGPGLFYQTIFEKPVATGYVARWPASRDKIRLEQDGLRIAGRYREMMEKSKATYFIRHRIALRPVTDPGLKLIARDWKYELYTWADSDIPGIDPNAPEPPDESVRVVAASPGSVEFEVKSPDSPGCGFCLAFSQKRIPGVPLTTDKYIELDDDLLLKLSMQPENDLFKNNWGTLDENGTARFVLDTSSVATTRGLELWCSLIVFEGDLVGQFRRIHRPVKIVLDP